MDSVSRNANLLHAGVAELSASEIDEVSGGVIPVAAIIVAGVCFSAGFIVGELID